MTEERTVDENIEENVNEAQEQSSAEQSEELTVEQLLEQAKVEADDYKDRWMRAQADFANAKKRMEKQRTQTYQVATADLAKKLLPAIDDFERALQNVPQPIAEDNWFEGVQLVHKKLSTILEQFDVQPIEAVGEPFDPNVHEAITAEPSAEYESGTIIKELQKGYKVGEQVIRPSLVVVAQ